MYRTIQVLLILITIFLLIGFVRGWFFFTMNEEPVHDRVNVNLTIDKDKMKSDANRVGEAASDLTGDTSPKTEPTPSDSRPAERERVTDQDSAFPLRPVSPELAK